MSQPLDRNTKITLGTSATLISLVLGAALWITGEVRAVCDEVHGVRLELVKGYATKAEVSKLQDLRPRVSALEALVGRKKK